MSDGGNCRCPNCAIVRPCQQFRPVKLVPGPGGVSDWIRCPACGFKAAKRRFAPPLKPSGVAGPRVRSKPRKPRDGAAKPAEAGARPQSSKQRGAGPLQDDLARVQALIAQVSAEFEGALKADDQTALDRLRELLKRLQADSFDLQVELALTDEVPPSK